MAKEALKKGRPQPASPSQSTTPFKALVDWFKEAHRPLPWRIDYDPYHVWVSEVMLQQTQVETALPYYERFIERFPTVKALAAASETSVLELWAGLGYYSRARNLRAAAQQVVRDHAGKVPSDYDELRELPGIGRYMAGAILSIAFNKPYPIVDGNVRRVLSRIYGWTEELEAQLWEAATKIAQQHEPRFVNQAMMELGAKVCSFRAPRCVLCPMQSACVAFKTGMQMEIPKPRKRPDTVHVQLVAVVHEKRGRYWMKHSKGFWEFPTFSKLPSGSFTEVGRCRHTITHHRIEVTVYTGALKETPEFDWKNPESVPISSLTRKIFASKCTNEL